MFKLRWDSRKERLLWSHKTCKWQNQEEALAKYCVQAVLTDDPDLRGLSCDGHGIRPQWRLSSIFFPFWRSVVQRSLFNWFRLLGDFPGSGMLAWGESSLLAKIPDNVTRHNTLAFSNLGTASERIRSNGVIPNVAELRGVPWREDSNEYQMPRSCVLIIWTLSSEVKPGSQTV